MSRMINWRIDPGHGQFDNKGVLDGYYEGTYMFRLAMHILDQSKKYTDMRVTSTRMRITDNPSLTARGSSAKGYDIFTSLHSNAPGVRNPKTEGFTVYDNVMSNNLEYANRLAYRGSRLMNTLNRGVRHRFGSGNWNFYTVLHRAHLAGCTFATMPEQGYHTNPDNCAWLMNDSNLQLLANLNIQVTRESFHLGEQEVLEMIGIGTVINVSSHLRVRDRPATGNVIDQLQNGTNVIVLETGINPDRRWAKIQMGSQQGFVHTGYLAVDTNFGGSGITQAQLDAEKKKVSELQSQATILNRDLNAAKADLTIIGRGHKAAAKHS